MTGDLPDEWFRSGTPEQSATPASSSRSSLGDATPGPDESSLSTRARAPRPAEHTEERFTDQFKPNYIPREGRRAATTPISTDTPTSGLGSNAAGATFTVGALREERPASRPRTRVSLGGARWRRWLQTALLLALMLGVGLVLGQILAPHLTGAGSSTGGGTSTGGSASPQPSASSSTSGADANPYEGATTPLRITSIKSSCTTPPPASGIGITSFAAANAIDDDPSTAWGCAHSAVGTTLTLTVPAGSTVVGMGLVNGISWAEGDSTDAYQLFRRVLSVKWTLPDGHYVVQGLSDPHEQEQLITIPASKVSGPVTLTILSVSSPGQSAAQFDATVLAHVTLLTQA